ncbi:MAG: hypothetical protein ACXWPM_10795, partial [Bdellovibrionota bacterium]
MKLLKITAALLLLLTPLASLSARADGQSDLDQARARRLGAAEKERAVVVESLNKAESNLQELVGQRHRLQEIANLIDKRGNAYDLLLKEISRVNGRILVLS